MILGAMTFWEAILLAVVEGITEYLPISSTGHIILTSTLLGIQDNEFVKDYTVLVQFGAILAVLYLYFQKIRDNFSRLWSRLAVGFLPAGILGLSVKDYVDVVLGDPYVVVVALVVGGAILLCTEKIFGRSSQVSAVEEISLKQALWVGIFQCLAFVPGVSRSAASIWGGLFAGLSMRASLEFSFILGLPTLGGAFFLKAVKLAPTITMEQAQILLVGNFIAFIVAILAIKSFLQFVQSRGLVPFGYYRILLGLTFWWMIL